MGKLTQAEKDRRKHERKAKAMNAAEAKAFGPLFAEMAPVHTADDAYWRNRFQKAHSVETHTASDRANRGLMWIELTAIERFARSLFPAEVVEPAIEYCRKTYPMPDYGRSVWSDFLEGRKRIAVKLHAEPDPAIPGRVKIVEDVVFPPVGWNDPVDHSDFERRFPTLDHSRGVRVDDEPDDGGLFERVLAMLAVGIPATPAKQ